MCDVPARSRYRRAINFRCSNSHETAATMMDYLIEVQCMFFITTHEISIRNICISISISIKRVENRSVAKISLLEYCLFNLRHVNVRQNTFYQGMLLVENLPRKNISPSRNV